MNHVHYASFVIEFVKQDSKAYRLPVHVLVSTLIGMRWSKLSESRLLHILIRKV